MKRAGTFAYLPPLSREEIAKHELDACKAAHPDRYIFITGYSPAAQHVKLDFIAYYPGK